MLKWGLRERRGSDEGTPNCVGRRLVRCYRGMLMRRMGLLPGVLGGFQDRLIPRFTPPPSTWPVSPGCSWRWSFPSRTGCEPPRSNATSGVKGGGKVGHVGGLIADSPSGTFCRRP